MRYRPAKDSILYKHCTAPLLKDSIADLMERARTEGWARHVNFSSGLTYHGKIPMDPIPGDTYADAHGGMHLYDGATWVKYAGATALTSQQHQTYTAGMQYTYDVRPVRERHYLDAPTDAELQAQTSPSADIEADPDNPKITISAVADFFQHLRNRNNGKRRYI